MNDLHKYWEGGISILKEKYEVIVRKVNGDVIHQGQVTGDAAKLASYLRKVAHLVGQQGDEEEE